MLPAEILFIRKTFRISSRELASALSAAPITVERWESGKNRPTGLQEAVLRALYQAAQETAGDASRTKSIRALLLLGIGTLIVTLLRDCGRRPSPRSR